MRDNKEEQRVGTTRRELMKRTAGGVLGTAITAQAIDLSTPVSATSHYWDVSSSDMAEVHSSGGIYTRRVQIGSSLNYYTSYSQDNGDKSMHGFLTQSEIVGREQEQDGDWYEESFVDYNEIELDKKSGGSDYVLLTNPNDLSDHIGARPPVRSDTVDPAYSETAQATIDIALGQIDDYLDYALSAAEIAAAMYNDVVGDDGAGKEEDGDQTRYSWDYEYNKTDASCHKKFFIQTTPDKSGSFRLSDWTYSLGNWLDNSWEIYYDGTGDPQAKETTGTSFGSLRDSGDSQKGPHPPENPEEWTHMKVPDNSPRKRVPVDEFPQNHPVHDFAGDDDYVIETQFPFWIRSRSPKRTTPPK